MKADLADLLELIRSVSEPERGAKAASMLKERGQGELISQVARLSRLVDRFFVQAFTQGRGGGLRKALEELSSALEELHDALISARPWVSGKEDVILGLVSSVISDVERCIERLMAVELEENERARGVGEACTRIERISDFLRNAPSLGPSPSARDILDLVRRFVPDEEDLASYLMVIEMLKGVFRKRGFYRVLAELISSWFFRSKGAERGCVRPADIRAWASDVLKVEIAIKDVEKALKLLVERGDALGITKEGLVIIRPREEDARKVFDLARERYRETGSGVSAQLLSQRFGWCVEYASTLIDELVRRGWLFPGPSQLIPGAKEYYPPPEDEGA